MKTFLLLIVMIFATVQSYTQIKIELTDGQKYEGILILDNKDSLKIETLNGLYHAFSKNSISNTTLLISRIN